MTSLRKLGGAVLLALLAACGSGSGSGAGADAFLGTWTYTSGTITPTMCVVLGTTIPPINETGQSLTITKADGSHIDVDAGSGCVIHFSVSGSTATAAANQTCTVTISGFGVALDISSWTLTLSGEMLTGAQSGSAPLGGAMCTASGTGMLSRSSGDAGAG